MASTIAPRALEKAPALVRAWVALPALLPGSACWRSPASDPLSQLVGWPRRRLAPPQEQLPAVIVGALTQAGVSEQDAHSYAEGVRRGGTLVSARVADADRSRLDAILNESAINLRDRSAAWQKAGWNHSIPPANPTAPRTIRKERQRYGGAFR
jgi:hypothetical protein